MIFDKDYLNIINYWSTRTLTIDNVVNDILIVNVGYNRIELKYKFPRFNNFSYHDSMHDYIHVFTKDIEFMEVTNQLLKKLEYLQYKYDYVFEQFNKSNKQRTEIDSQHKF